MKKRILVVDDEAANIKLISKALYTQYDITGCSDASDCLANISDINPDAILLDVMMPNMDGFQLCQALRGIPGFEHTPILFLSALDSLEKKLRGYEVGGDDYFTKPLQIAEVQAKVARLIDKDNQIQQYQQQTAESFNTAMTAMVNGGEIGEVNQFFEHLHGCKSYQQLSTLVLDSCTRFGLNCALQLRPNGESIQASANNTINPLEYSLLEQAVSADRIITVGRRCMFNYQAASLLVRNMPLDDADKAGRLRDHLCSIMNGVEARMVSLGAELALQDHQQGLIMQSLRETQQALDITISQFKAHDAQTREIVEQLSTDLQISFSMLDLNEEQERSLTSTVSRAAEALSSLSRQGAELDSRFETIISHLSALAHHEQPA